MVERSDGVICVVDEMQERLGVMDNPNVISVQNTFPFSDKVLEVSENSANITFYFVGGVTPIRGLDIVIAGFSKLIKKHQDVELIIAGNGSELSNIKKRAAELHLTDNVKFLGWVKQNDALRLMEDADIMLLPHKRHIQTDCSSPNKLYQYMYSCKPILASDCKSIERVINETESGLIYKYDDPNSFAECAEKLINDSALRKKLGVNGYKAVKEKYNWAVDSGKLVSLYKKLLNEE